MAAKKRKKYAPRGTGKYRVEYSERIKPAVLPVERVIIETLEDYERLKKAYKILKVENENLKAKL